MLVRSDSFYASRVSKNPPDLSGGEVNESLRRSQSMSSIFAEIDESIRSISEDEWEEVPADASKRLDDDLYGPSDA